MGKEFRMLKAKKCAGTRGHPWSASISDRSWRFLFLAAALALTSCDKPRPDSWASKTPDAAIHSPQGATSDTFEITTKSGVPMVYVPGGEFMMGSPHGYSDEAPAHKVKVGGFFMDKFEVTHEWFTKAQMPNPSHWQDHPRKPVERVRWRDAKQYCNERSLLEGLKPCYNEKTPDWDCDYAANGYRLPTEAEWEYACRAGQDGPYDFGSPDKLRQYAWFAGNADQKTHIAGQKKPNRWGLYDLYGNVSEWCEDVYSPTFYKESPAVDPHGPPNPGKDVKRVIRGGSWKSSPDLCRATARRGERTGDTDACFSTDYCGFRCVRRATPEAAEQLRIKPK
jgi:formylglycine-generating enzyme required for sulfatase activity